MTFLAVVGLAGCSTPPPTRQAAAEGEATCCVCQYNNDLACVNVHVKDSTPRTQYGDRTYYFCSSSCCAAFQRKPQKYLAGSSADRQFGN